jgi:hypothetical protein
VAARSSSRAQLAEVVDLAVEHDPHRAVFVVDRLMAGREIDDAEAPHAERHAIGDPRTLVVRAAVPNHIAHAMHQRAALVARER